MQIVLGDEYTWGKVTWEVVINAVQWMDRNADLKLYEFRCDLSIVLHYKWVKNITLWTYVHLRYDWVIGILGLCCICVIANERKGELYWIWYHNRWVLCTFCYVKATFKFNRLHDGSLFLLYLPVQRTGNHVCVLRCITLQPYNTTHMYNIKGFLRNRERWEITYKHV